MGNYSADERSVRVDFFKESTKWYCTEAVIWQGPWKADDAPLIWDQFAHSLREHLRRVDGSGYRLRGMTAICLEPYHEHAFPLMMKVDDAVSAQV